MEHAVQGARGHVSQPGTHVVVPPAGPQASGDDPPVARAHGTETQDAEIRIVPAPRDPAEHAAAMAVDPVPHDLANEAADLQKARDPVDLGRSDRSLVPADLASEGAIARPVVRLAAARAQARIRLHSAHERLEIARWQLEVQVQLAEVVELGRVNRLVARVEGFHDAGPHTSSAAILTPHDADEVQR